MDKLSLADIEDAISDRSYLGPLPKAMEAEFALRTARFQRLLTRNSMWPTLTIYNAFLVVDYFLLPETFSIAVILHVIVTTLIVAICTRNSWLPERCDSRWIMAAIPMTMLAQIMTIYSLNASDNALHYQYLSTMIVV